MTIGDFVEMAIDNIYNCYVWDNEREEKIFRGILCDIPDDLLTEEFSSWEMENNSIGFNIN